MKYNKQQDAQREREREREREGKIKLIVRIENLYVTHDMTD